MGPKATIEPNRRKRTTKQHCLPPPQPYPWLLYFNGKDSKNQTFCTISNPTKTYSRSIPELGEATLLTVQHGWCLMEKKLENVSKLSLWNPSSLNKINLPPLKCSGIDDIIFSSSPTSANEVCSIFIFSAYETHSSIIYYFQLGDKQWTEVDYREDLMKVAAEEGRELEENDFYLTNPVYCKGCLYAKSFFGYFLVVIEKLQPHGLKINSARISLPAYMLTSFFPIRKLLESNNELFHIEILHAQGKVIAVFVHRLDFSSMVWEKVKNINDRVFFISNYFGPHFVCQAINPETEGGRIYFNLEDNNFVYIYNIENNSLNISQPFSNLPKKRSSSWWFMPDIRMNGSLKVEKENTQTREEEESGVAIYSKKIEDDGVANAFALPLNMVEEIAEHLNVIDYLHFRATNRLLCQAAPPIQWKSFSSMSTSRLSPSPFFVFIEKEKVLTIAHPKHGLKYKYSINLLDDFKENCEICYSKDGWLLLAVNTLSYIFFNPFTREVKQLAFGPLTNRNIRCVGFSHPPTSSECRVVEFNKMAQLSRTMANITYLGNVQWDDFYFEETNFPLYNMSPTYHKGKFYYISEKGKLGVLNVGEDISWRELEKPCAPCANYCNIFLVDCNDTLLSIFEGPFGKWVQVFKLNESELTWIKVRSLGNYMLLVGNTSFSVVANISGMENKIYFPRLYDKNVVFYSLETNNYHTFENEVVNFHNMREQLNSCWIEPRWH